MQVPHGHHPHKTQITVVVSDLDVIKHTGSCYLLDNYPAVHKKYHGSACN
jgi:hypothetical protein